MVAILSLQLAGQWAVDYLSFICVSEGLFHHKSALIWLLGHYFCLPLELYITVCEVKFHNQTVLKDLIFFFFKANSVMMYSVQHSIQSTFAPLKSSLGTLEQVIYIVH